MARHAGSSRWAIFAGPRVHWWVGLALLVPAGPAGAAIVVLRATSATVDETGGAADVCVVLDSGAAQVAGTQNDLVWDGSCATLPSASACRINPAIGKDTELFGDLAHQPDFTFQAIVLSLSDTSPLPDGELYCCAFQVEAPSGACCAIGVTNPAASDPDGRPIPAVGGSAQVCVDGSMQGSTTDDDDGCQVGPRHTSARVTLIPLGVAVLLVVRRRQRS